MNKKKLIVIGGGAAGFFCAINAARINPDLEVIILEKSSKLLNKVRISGGGRCNVTHDEDRISEMVKNYPRGNKFLKKAFHQFFTREIIDWFQERKVTLKTEHDGRMFPITDSSETIIECFLQEAKKYQVEIFTNKSVVKIKPKKEKFILEIADGENLTADFICVACGGFPKSLQYQWLENLGHQIESPVPSLFTFNLSEKRITHLMGITIDEVEVKIKGTSFIQQGPLLITHWGFSGPAILKLSSFAARYLSDIDYDFEITVNWIPDFNENSMVEKLRLLRNNLGNRKVGNKNPFELPHRLWEFLLQEVQIDPECRWSDLPAKNQNLLAKILCTHTFQIKGKTTFKEEFVTAGGIRLDEIDVQTMESKMIKNLFFAGEILNVDAITGGFNFQNAWTTAWIAAKEIGSR